MENTATFDPNSPQTGSLKQISQLWPQLSYEGDQGNQHFLSLLVTISEYFYLNCFLRWLKILRKFLWG